MWCLKYFNANKNLMNKIIKLAHHSITVNKENGKFLFLTKQVKDCFTEATL